MAEQIPESIGKYKIVELVAQGGMGCVYKAVHPSLKRNVIIKKLTIRNNSIVKERFKREAQILLDMQSPYIVHLFDYFIEGSSHYIVEEYVDGMSLSDLLKKQIVLGTQLSLLIVQDALLALKFAHSKGIVHRDIKPGNILISKRAGIKLCDFGIASSDSLIELNEGNGSKSKEAVADDSLTQIGTTLGTPAYMSPEQITDSRNVDNRADIYSIGVMLYELITGSKPFPSNLSKDTLSKIKKAKYVSPRKIDKTIPKSVEHMIKVMLKANPSKRYQSVDPILKIIKRNLQKFDQHDIRYALAQSVVYKKQFDIPAFEPKKNPFIKIAKICGVFCLLAIIMGSAWYYGFIHRTVLRKWYTPVSVSMQLPVNGSVKSDLPVRAFFFIDDNNEIPEVANTRRVLKKINENKMYNLYGAKTVFLKHGNYRLKVAVGPYVIWKTFNTDEQQITISLESLRRESRTLSVKSSAYDSKTLEDISSRQKLSILYKNKWTDIKNVPAESLKTGTVWKIKSEAEGYAERQFSLRIDWYQDTLIIETAMDRL